MQEHNGIINGKPKSGLKIRMTLLNPDQTVFKTTDIEVRNWNGLKRVSGPYFNNSVVSVLKKKGSCLIECQPKGFVKYEVVE